MSLYRRDDFVLDTNGNAIAGAQVYYLANQPGSTTTTVDLTQLASVWSDSTGAVSVTNPMTTDGFGHANSSQPNVAGYLTAGYYTVVYQVNGVILQVFNDQLVGELQSGINALNVTQAPYEISTAGTGFAPYAAQITIDTATLTVTGNQGCYQFTNADVGKAVQVVGAGASGADLYTTISSYIGPTQVTLANNAGTSVKNAFFFIYPAGKLDRVALQAAINATTPTCGSVYLPTGVYVIDQPLVASQYLSNIVGDGPGQTWIIVSSSSFSGNILDFTQLTGKATAVTVKGISLKHIGLVPPSQVTNVQITRNVVTVTCTNSFVPGQQVIIQGLQTGAFANELNDAFLTIVTASGSQFTAAFTNADVGSTSVDAYVYPLQQCGLSFALGFREFLVQDMFILCCPGAGFQAIECIVGKLQRVISQHNVTGFNILSPNTVSGVAGDTSTHFDVCYANGNYMAGYYLRTCAYNAFSACAADSNSVNYYIYTSPGVALMGCGSEAARQRSTSFNGHYYFIRGGPGVCLIGCYYNCPVGNQASQVPLYGFSASQMFVAGLRGVVNIGATAPTNEIFLDSGCVSCTIINPALKSTTAWTDHGKHDNIMISGQWQTPMSWLETTIMPTPQFTNSPAVASGDFAISAGWGSTASLSLVSGNNASGTVQVTAGGTGIAANPTLTFTYHTGDTFTKNPNIVQSRFDSSVSDAGIWVLTALSTTSCTWTYVGTPVTGHTYGIGWNLTSNG